MRKTYKENQTGAAACIAAWLIYEVARQSNEIFHPTNTVCLTL